MIQTQQHCRTPDQLLTFLRGQLGSRDECDLQLHLNDCVLCRERLENAAADANSWNEAKLFFRREPSHESFEDATNGQDDATRWSHRIRQVLDSLRPSDDPESLGRIGGYEVSGVVGAGGMGVVLKAHDRSLDRIVAIKVMSPHLASSGSARKRFAREAKAAAAVLHPNVIAIHSVACDEVCPYLVMPYVRGASLQKRIESQGPLPLKDTLRIGAQIAAGLAAAHEQGLVHRDIKPANILLGEGVERVTITDFGLARAVDDASMTCSGVIAGTPQYMSPEQTRGEPLDARSDLFSLGSVLYAMCAGRSPFRAGTTYGVLHRIASDNPTPICEVNSDVPEWLSHIIERLMAKRPDNRFESAAQVAELLEGCLAHVQQPAAMPLPELVAALAPQRVRRPPIGKFIAAAAFAFSLIFAGVLVVLELNKGTLTIESEADDVPIRIMQGDNVVDRLIVAKSGNSIRVSAGAYVVELEAEVDGMTIENNQVLLERGANEHIKIRLSTTEGNSTAASSRISDATIKSLQGVWEFISVESDGVVAEYKKLETQPSLFQLTITDDLWAVNAGDGSNASVLGNGNRHRVKIDDNRLTFYGTATSMPGIGDSLEVPTIGYGLFKLDGDSLVYLMTPASVGGDFTNQGTAPTKFPETFETKGTQNNVYRLRRVGANVSKVHAPSSSTVKEIASANAGSLVKTDARSVVEAYVSSVLAGDVAKAAALAKNSPAEPKHIAEFPELLNVQRLKVQTVYINDPANPTRALATSEAVKLDADHQQPNGERDGFMVFTLELTDENWFVVDIDFESAAGAEKELKRFLEANHAAVGLPPRTLTENREYFRRRS
jgi:serine/threonine protein kinase